MRIFFVVLHNMLTSKSEVSEVHCVKDAKVPLMRVKLDGISIDLPYAQLKVMFIPELSVMHVEPNLSKQSVPTVVSAYTQGSHNVDILNPFFLRNIDETSWRSLFGVHANKCILRLLPNMKVSSMLSMGSYVILQDGMVPMTISASEIRSLMPIRLPCRPHGYCHSNITKSTFYRIRTEFHRGHALTKVSRRILSLTVVPAISIVVRQFGRFLHELPHSTQSAAAVAASIAEGQSFGGTNDSQKSVFDLVDFAGDLTVEEDTNRFFTS
ncbi:unnamed protein product [Camellia sinensis]